MNDQMQNGMAEATRLTQQGRLDEATAAIQRALGGTLAPAATPDGSADEPIEVASLLIKGTPHKQASHRYTADGKLQTLSLFPSAFSRLA